jgi:DegT/DnrJ/EryC1/StrS aminotransferase family
MRQRQSGCWDGSGSNDPQNMSGVLRKLAGTLYSGCRPLQRPDKLPPPLEGADFRYFAYGRHALVEAFALSGVRKGDSVLLPEYICRETLSAVNAFGAKVEYYPVGADMLLDVSPDLLPKARAIVAINYFGFPQELAKFQAYCSKTGAILIEDNAHGFLSRNERGVYLGMRGDIGIFSFRKSIPLVNGSAMVVNHPDRILPLSPQLPFVNCAESGIFRIKKLLRCLPEWGMTRLLYGIIRLDRAIRRFRTGNDYVSSGDESETVLPDNPEPCSNLLQVLKSLDVDCEISRRRTLYSGIAQLIQQYGGIPVFRTLPENVVPYCFPFRFPSERIEEIRKVLRRSCLDCHPWPELPLAIEQMAVERYNSVWMVNFIW